jgi:hypothetical protein
MEKIKLNEFGLLKNLIIIAKAFGLLIVCTLCGIVVGAIIATILPKAGETFISVSPLAAIAVSVAYFKSEMAKLNKRRMELVNAENSSTSATKKEEFQDWD